MKPDDPSNSQGGMSLSENRLVNHNSDDPPQEPRISTQDAAANIVRMQIDRIYDEHGNPSDQNSPYERKYSEDSGEKVMLTNDWQKYHSAWQNYYQKYYEGYYKHHSKKSEQLEGHNYFHETLEPERPVDTLSEKDAIENIRQQIVSKVKHTSKKVRKSRHFIPVLAGLVVVLFFLILQYNRLIIGNVVAYISPGNIDPQNIVIDPNSSIVVGPEPRLIIPKINVDVPVIYGVSNDNKSQLAAMTKGVAHFAIPGADSHPGQIGNTVISGHSSNDLLDTGDYKFIFAQLDKLVVGDTIYANYKSKRYTYIVSKKEVVSPSQVNKLIYPTKKPILTLLTCTPIGTAINRLLVTAEQVSPDPSGASPAPTDNTTDSTSIPGNSPTFIERLFGSR